MNNKINGSEQKYKSIKFKEIESIFLQYGKDEITNSQIKNNNNINNNQNQIVKIPIFEFNSMMNEKLKEKLKKCLTK
jgi:hypothetical protein